MSLESMLLGGKYSGLTSFFSFAYLAVFLPLSVIGFAISPKKVRKYFLLLVSWFFVWLISGKLIVYLLLTVVSLFLFGKWLERIQTQRDVAMKEVERPQRKEIKQRFLKKSRKVLAFAVVLHIGLLLVLKYTPFFATNVNSVFSLLNIDIQVDVPKFIMPIGISFFTMQAVSYLVDVYHGVIKAEENIAKLALWMSFFPQMVEGPICRYKQTADSLWNSEQIRFDNLTLGLQRILYGVMKKIVVADRLNPMVKEVFCNYSEYEGGIVALAAIAYTVQLYMDFSGSMDAVIGTAQIFGIKMSENFKRPFFSSSISDFWARWHITLGAWFKDYIFYPVSMSKPMKKLTSNARKKIGNHYGPLLAGSVALFCVWLSNGLWHGSAWSYIFFGMYHFALILCGNLMSQPVKFIREKLHINPENTCYKGFQILRTTVLVVIGELFFRAYGLRNGLAMFKNMVTDFRFGSLNNELLDKMGMDTKDFIVVGVAVAIVFVVSILNEKGINVREKLKTKNIALRWCVWYALILFIVIFGAYGYGYVPLDPIYADF